MLTIKNICKTFNVGDEKQEVLKNINLTINEGDFITIMGPSGGGKSTLLYIIGLLESPTSGEICLHEQRLDNLKENKVEEFRGANIGLIFQNANLIPSLTTIENLIIAMRDKRSFKEKKRKGEELLKKVGLLEKKNSKTAALSGGEAQRAAVVRALVNDPKLILSDEPTGALDSANGEKVIELLLKLRKETNCSLLIVTHDESIGALGDRRLLLKDGVLNELV